MNRSGNRGLSLPPGKALRGGRFCLKEETVNLQMRVQGHFFGFAFFTADFLAPFFALFFPLPMSALAAW